MRERSSFIFAFLIGMLLIGSGCDSTPEALSGVNTPPLLSEFSFSPRTLALQDIPADQIVNDRVRVTLSLSVVARDPDGVVEEVRYIVEPPRAGEEPLSSGNLELAGDDRYESEVALEIPKASVGKYTVLVYATDREGALSNNVRGLLNFVAVGSAPAIESIEAPETIQRPASGEPAKTLEIVAVVTDPDGPASVTQVSMWNVTRPDIQLVLLDDGGSQSGDDVAGDNRFTITVSIESTNTPGTNTFAFQAVDRSGLTSSIVEKQITVQ